MGEREQLALQIGRYCSELASDTSSKLETEGRKGVLEPFLAPKAPDSEPSWKPQLLGPLTFDQLAITGAIDQAAQRRFCFYHADLGPKNIVVDDDGQLTGVLNWESAAFYPEFWLATKPLLSAGFFLENSEADRQAWASLLTSALQREGFAPDNGKYVRWKTVMNAQVSSHLDVNIALHVSCTMQAW